MATLENILSVNRGPGKWAWLVLAGAFVAGLALLSGAFSQSGGALKLDKPYEAEYGNVATPMAIGYDVTASNKRYVAQTTESGAGHVDFRFSVGTSGTYQLEGNVRTSGGAENSFTVQFDSAEASTWQLGDNFGTWTWEGGPTATLSAGRHAIRIGYRSADTKLDRIEIRTMSLSSPEATPTSTPTTTQTSVPTPAVTSVPSGTIVPIGTTTLTPTPRAPTASPTATAAATPVPNSGFVTANGRSLQLGGTPYRFNAVNRYNLLTINPPGGPFRGCGGSWTDAQLAAWFAELPTMNVNAVRLWAFQLFTASGTDFSRMDYLLSLAGQHNVKVILTFENQWEHCTQGGFKYDTWYASGYRSPYGSYTMSYRDYVGVFVNRYKDDNRILMWQLMNEAGISTTSGQCGDPQIFKNFAADVSGYIKSIDGNHLVNIGTMGNGQCGAGGNQYQSLHDIPTIDLCEYHDYNSPTAPMPGDLWNGLQVRFNQCNALNKPLFIGEAGIKSNCSDPDCFTQQQRADLFNAKMAAFYNAGGVGYAIWSYRDWNGVDPPWTFDAADPLAQVIGRY